MTRLDELTLKLADSELSESGASELALLLGQDARLLKDHVRLLELEASLRGQRTNMQLAEATMAQLRSHLAGTLTDRVMSEIKTGADRSADAHIRPANAIADTLADVGIRAPEPRRKGSAGQFHRIVGLASALMRQRVPLALAASVALLVCLSIWYFGPTMGEPLLAEVKGVDVSVERGTEFVPGANGIRLQATDVLRVGTNASATVTFGPEKTRLELFADTELKVTSWSDGKQFTLRSGKLEASIAHQRPFEPMLIRTPQAEVRVLGTKFTLTVTTNATRLDVAEGTVRLRRASDGTRVDVPADHYAIAAANVKLAALPQTGGILWEYWTNIPGDYFTTLFTTHPDYPDRPSGQQWLDKFEAPSNWGTNYGARFRGFVHPPITGGYTFYIAGSGGGEFLLSRDDNPQNRAEIARADPSGQHEWTKMPRQQTSVVPLTAGRRYYIEALTKQGGKVPDHLAVGWRRPDGTFEVIPGEFLSPFKPKPKEKKS